MICIVCGNQAGYQKNVCENCLLKTKKMKCKDCTQSKFENQFYVYKKTNKPYGVCKDCFNKKVMCENCHQMINKTYLNKHIKVCKIKFGSGIQNKENSKPDFNNNLENLREKIIAKLRSIDLKLLQILKKIRKRIFLSLARSGS